jgi:hypothetical protein
MPLPGNRFERRTRRTAWVLVLIGFIALVAACVGAGYAIEANSPANRLSSPLADVGVVDGAIVAFGAGVVTVACWVAAIVKHHGRPYDQSREWWLS